MWCRSFIHILPHLSRVAFCRRMNTGNIKIKILLNVTEDKISALRVTLDNLIKYKQHSLCSENCLHCFLLETVIYSRCFLSSCTDDSWVITSSPYMELIMVNRLKLYGDVAYLYKKRFLQCFLPLRWSITRVKKHFFCWFNLLKNFIMYICNYILCCRSLLLNICKKEIKKTFSKKRF